ncbi:MAG: hypothetical protein EXS17_06560 [Phycisphaerales bacterium]|nr:hypothetical protein [Phycisphaerales bacterium]
MLALLLMTLVVTLSQDGKVPIVAPPSGPDEERETKRSAARPPLSFDSPMPVPEVAQWLNGSAPDFSDRAKVFLFVFWASNITPAREALPRLSVIADGYRSQGVVVVGMTTEPADGIRPLLDSPIYKDAITFAIGCDPDRSTFQQFMTASWQTSLPTVFLAQGGKVLWIGTPREVEAVLKSVLAGTWTVHGQADAHQRDAATMKRAGEFEQRLNVLVDRRDWDGMLAVLGEMEVDSDASLAREGRLLRIGVLQQAGRTDEALRACDALVESTKDWIVAAEVAKMLSSPLFVKHDVSRATLGALKAIALSKQKQALAYVALARVQARCGQSDLALRSLERALTLALPDERDLVQEEIEMLKSRPAPTP